MAVTNFQLTPLDPGRSFLQGQAMGQEMRSNKLRDLVMQQQAQQNQRIGDLKSAGMERDNKMAEFRQNLTGVGLIGAALKETRPESPEQAAQVFNMMKEQLGSAGFDVSDLGEFDPQQMPKYAQAYNAARHAGLLKSDSEGIPAGLREFMALSDTADLSPEERRQAARVEMGLIPRAGTVTGQERIATTDGLREQVATSEGLIAGARAGSSESAELDAQLEKLPQVKAAVAQAEGRIKNEVESEATARRNAITLNMYDTAMQGVMESLQNTETGPVAGRMPAVTSEQQIAEGSLAAMAPILKSLFRTAGEGTFTDKDQELLLNMLPKRTDTPDAIQAKMQNIDAIVRAKLNGGQSMQTAQTPAPQAQSGPSIDDLVNQYAD